MKNRLVELLAEKMQREKRLITPSELARETKISRQNVHRWLNNEITSFPSETLDKICDYIPCELSDLLVRVQELEAQQ